MGKYKTATVNVVENSAALGGDLWLGMWYYDDDMKIVIDVEKKYYDAIKRDGSPRANKMLRDTLEHEYAEAKLTLELARVRDPDYSDEHARREYTGQHPKSELFRRLGGEAHLQLVGGDERGQVKKLDADLRYLGLEEGAVREYKSGSNSSAMVGSFASRRGNQGIPLQPVPMSGQTGQPQTALWSIADAIMSSTMRDDVDIEYDDQTDDDIHDEPRIADWDVWNTPRYDLQRFYQAENKQKVHSRTSRVTSRPYLDIMEDRDAALLREYIRLFLEVSAVSTGGGSGVASGDIRGVVTPLGTGPTHPKKSDKKGAKRRTNKRLQIAAASFGDGKIK